MQALAEHRARAGPAMHDAAFRDLARVFARLERTSSNTAMLRILARYLPALSPEDVRLTAYLLSGTVGPSFSAPQFGMAGKMAARAIAQAYEIPLSRVARMAIRSGDLGEAAEALGGKRRSNLSIRAVFTRLRSIAQLAGSGSQQAKIDALTALLRQASGTESKYIVRTVLGTHRIGAGEMTFLYGLANAFGASSADKNRLEYAYNVLSDLGEVAARVARGGVRALSRVSPKPGIPVRMMLAGRVEDLDEVPLHLKDTLFAEYKYDGERVQIHKDAGGALRVFSRRLEEITHQYPEVVEHVRRNLRARTAILEGEVVAIDRKTRHLLPFQVVMRRKRKLQVAHYLKQVPVALFAFDLLYLNGKSLLDRPLSERKRLLEKHLAAGSIAQIGAFIVTGEMTEVEKYFHQAIARGAEGVVIKGAASPYRAGRRGWYWIKFKKEYQRELADTFDVVVVGALYGKGSRAGSYGSLLVAAYDPKKNTYYSFTKVGAGITGALLRSLPEILKPHIIKEKYRLLETGMKMDVWFEPAKVLEISGADLTVSPIHTVAKDRIRKGGIALRFPRLLRIRSDKSAEQVTTVQELWDMYNRRLRAARGPNPARIARRA